MLDPLTAAWLMKHFGLKPKITYRSSATTGLITTPATLNTLLDLVRGAYDPGWCRDITVDTTGLAPEKIAALKALGFEEMSA